MNVQIHLTLGETKIDETTSGDTAETVVANIRDRVAKEMGFLVGGFIKRMSPLDFAREATRRYNAAAKDTAPAPATCEEFLRMAVSKGFASIDE
ncbi:MAG: hypothetical protein H7Z41_00735 [Cytophagales bacterium]|nr:hypothetical protein [Armatimonadota bacterium]